MSLKLKRLQVHSPVCLSSNGFFFFMQLFNETISPVAKILCTSTASDTFDSQVVDQVVLKILKMIAVFL